MEYEALRKVTAAILGMDPEEIRPEYDISHRFGSRFP